MESSRGGPLTTFIMMLPLIVVPTVAMLKPAGSPMNWATEMLSAGSEDGPSAGPDRPASEQAGTIAAIFGPEESQSSDEDLFKEAIGDAFPEDFGSSMPPESNATSGAESEFAGGFDPSSNAQPATSRPSAAELERGLAELRKLGATQTMWFPAGPNRQGLAVFFHSQATGRTLRFEAVEPNQAAAIRRVIEQIQRYRRP